MTIYSSINGNNVHHTDFGAGGGGSGDVGENLLLSEGTSATLLFAARFLP